MLNLIGCIDRPTAGSILFDGLSTATMGDDAEAGLRLGQDRIISRASISFPC